MIPYCSRLHNTYVIVALHWHFSQIFSKNGHCIFLSAVLCNISHSSWQCQDKLSECMVQPKFLAVFQGRHRCYWWYSHSSGPSQSHSHCLLKPQGVPMYPKIVFSFAIMIFVSNTHSQGGKDLLQILGCMTTHFQVISTFQRGSTYWPILAIPPGQYYLFHIVIHATIWLNGAGWMCGMH